MSYLKLGIYAALGLALLGSHVTAYRAGGEHTRRVVATQGEKRLQNALQALLEAQERAQELDIALQKKLNEPKAAPKIERLVRENPSSCPRPKPVSDGLRDEVERRNADIRASL